MDILNEIIEESNQIIDTMDEHEFFEENLFIERLQLKRNFQIAMQRKWEQDDNMFLTDTEFLKVCNDTMEENISTTIMDLVEKGALDMSVNPDGEILYSNNKDVKLDVYE
jgi:hypothetical protein